MQVQWVDIPAVPVSVVEDKEDRSYVYKRLLDTEDWDMDGEVVHHRAHPARMSGQSCGVKIQSTSGYASAC